MQFFFAQVKESVEEMNKEEENRWNSKLTGSPHAAVGSKTIWA
jgi:hypothetical protein